MAIITYTVELVYYSGKKEVVSHSVPETQLCAFLAKYLSFSEYRVFYWPNRKSILNPIA